MKLLLFNLIYTIKAINPEPSHFRIIPLNFYTFDNRNDQYFRNQDYYGVRIGWIASIPPSNTIIINDNNHCFNLNWQTKGLFNPHKNQWGNNLWDYSFSDIGLYIGTNIITIGPWSYNVKIPRYGQRITEDDTTLFIGDPNIGPSSQYSLGNADDVIKSIIMKQQNKTSLIIWLGDIFYHDNADSIFKEWPKLTIINKNNILGVPTYLHIGILGNHDYSSDTGCDNCHWNIRKDNLLCVNNNKISGSWLQYFFMTDSFKSFHQGLSDIYHRGCRVPYEYSIQIIVIGRTAYITIDNTWHPNEVNIDWNSVNNKINNHVDTIIIIGHWDYINLGAKSSVSDWITYLYKFFKKEIIGVQGHTHVNNIKTVVKNNNLKYKLITVGGNGFRGAGCNCNGNCYNCHCCCPTLYKNNNWIIGGWNKDQLCNS